MTRLDRFARGLAMVWAGFVLGAVLLSRSEVNPDSRLLVAMAAAAAITACVVALIALALRRSGLAGGALVVAALVAPTFAAAALNLVPLVTGALLFLRRRRTVQAR
jgi:hypothetical protein